VIADSLSEFIKPDASAAASGADMTLQRHLEVVTPLPALRPLDKSLNALTGGLGCGLAGTLSCPDVCFPIATGFGKTVVQGSRPPPYVRLAMSQLRAGR
jgi:hypothetical protein